MSFNANVPGLDRASVKQRARVALFAARDERPDEDLTTAEVRILSRMARRANPGLGFFPATDAMTWLTQDVWSPHIDEVAVRRALALDWTAIRSLTHLEYEELITRLARTYDPFGDYDIDPSAVRSPYGDVVEGERRMGDRARAFRDAPLADQRTLRRALAHRLSKPDAPNEPKPLTQSEIAADLGVAPSTLRLLLAKVGATKVDGRWVVTDQVLVAVRAELAQKATTCAEPACSTAPRRRGLCEMHYQRWRHAEKKSAAAASVSAPAA
ncbi:hypothetical protein [Oerskovia enterophila]|uniref:HTH crp-type domain-containing protein n=1 Tax=Oerskovia enterophila TaxID=43678 RepID=A0ABX2Y9K4_9CELL|nr:hypothetical protein [Oerskovia enterophila]OCI32902.1 hypothetical protein OERS_04940 [Oerskovia enterophila]